MRERYDSNQGLQLSRIPRGRTNLPDDRLPQPLQLLARDVRPLARIVQFQVGFPVMDRFQWIAQALAQEGEIEMRVRVLRVQRQGAPVVVQRLGKTVLFEVGRAACTE